MNSFDLEDEYVSRMVNIQNRGGAYEKALGSIKAGRLSDAWPWPWFVFPFISEGKKRIPRGKARACAIPAKDCVRFAQALLAHEVTGPRLRKAYMLFKSREGGGGSCIIGGQKAAENFLSFMTLFEHASHGFPEHNADLRHIKSAWFGDKNCAHTQKAILQYVYSDSSTDGASRSCSEDGDGAPEVTRKQRRFLNLLKREQGKRIVYVDRLSEGSNTGPFTELPTNPAWYECMFPVVVMDRKHLEDMRMTTTACDIPPCDCINVGTAFLRDPSTGGTFLNVCKHLAAFVQKISRKELENSKAWVAHRRRLLSSLTFFERVLYGHETWRYVCFLLIHLFEDKRCTATKALFACLEFGSETTEEGLCRLVAEICEAGDSSGDEK